LTLNDPTYVEAARALAERVLLEAGPSAEARIERAFRLVVARQPSPAEMKVLLASHARIAREFARDRAAAERHLGVGESKRSENLDPIEHAVFTVLGEAILNLDEALTKE
jgi:hypothetical protein